MKMELNSLGAAREDTHGTPEKLRGKMYSFFFCFSLFLSFTLVPRACHSPTSSTRLSQQRLFLSTLARKPSSPSPPIPAFGTRPPLLERLRDDNEDCHVSYPLALYLPRPSTPTNPSFRCKWPFYVDSCSFSRANMPWQMCIYIYTCTRV